MCAIDLDVQEIVGMTDKLLRATNISVPEHALRHKLGSYVA